MNYHEIVEAIVTSIVSQVSKLIEAAKFDRTFKAQIVDKVGINRYTVLHKNLYLTANSKESFAAGDVVWVRAPQNNWQELYIDRRT